MKMNFRILWLAVIVLSAGVYGCDNEEALQPNSVGNGIVFAFPEGDEAWDRDLVEIAEQFGTKCIYKNLTLTDLTRTWLPSTGTVVGYVGQGLVSDRQARQYTQFFKEHVFRFLNSEVTQEIFPNYIFFAHDFCSVNYRILPEGDTLVWNGTPTVKYDGMGYWAFSFESEEHLNIMGNPWQQHMFTTATEVMQNREVVLKNIFNQMVNKRVIVPPAAFAMGGGLDYATPIVYGAAKVDDENYFKRRGFPEQMRNLKQYVKKPTDLYSITNTGPIETFVDYLWLAFRYTGDVIRENYKDFPLVIRYYELTVEYMKENYGMDISLIAEVPESGLDE